MQYDTGLSHRILNFVLVHWEKCWKWVPALLPSHARMILYENQGHVNWYMIMKYNVQASQICKKSVHNCLNVKTSFERKLNKVLVWNNSQSADYLIEDFDWFFEYPSKLKWAQSLPDQPVLTVLQILFWSTENKARENMQKVLLSHAPMTIYKGQGHSDWHTPEARCLPLSESEESEMLT